MDETQEQPGFLQVRIHTGDRNEPTQLVDVGASLERLAHFQIGLDARLATLEKQVISLADSVERAQKSFDSLSELVHAAVKLAQMVRDAQNGRKSLEMN